MSNLENIGILVVGHGSRRAEANKDIRDAATLIGRQLEMPLVEPAFLEIECPNVAEGFARLVERGATRIIVHPYFLSPGRHTRGDLPVKVAEASVPFPNVHYRITEPLASHNLVIAASVDRIKETLHWQEYQDDDLTGKVYLVGAGPGDPGLLTLRAAELIRSADTIIYDRLVNPEVFKLARIDADRIYVGKICGGARTSQKEINRLLIEHAKNGERVVRLKGGDPFIFGRGGEEAEALNRARIEFEVVPGISSAIAVPAYAGIPLTHRGLATSVAVLTGYEAAASDASSISQGRGPLAADTLVILMGLTKLPEIVRGLIAAGRSSDTPVAIVSWGTYEKQRVVSGYLSEIAERVATEGLRTPGVIIVGAVVRLRRELEWFRPQRIDTGIENLRTVPATA
jgi:uroporphyrin-III C-methyltransferase